MSRKKQTINAASLNDPETRSALSEGYSVYDQQWLLNLGKVKYAISEIIKISLQIQVSPWL